MNSSYRTKSAFTLIETLLGLIIFSIISLCLYAAFQSGINIEQKSRSSTKVFNKVHIVLDSFAKDIENMRPFNFVSSYPKRQSFKGDANQMTQIIAGPEGLQILSYYSGYNAQQGYFLARQVQPFWDYWNEIQSTQKDEILLTSILEKVKFQYAGKGQTGFIWQDHWEQSSLPYKVRLEFKINDPSKKGQPLILSREVNVPIATGLIKGSL